VGKTGKGKKRKEVAKPGKAAAAFSQFFSKRKKVDNNGADDNDGDDEAGARDEAMRPVDPSPVEGRQQQRLSPTTHTTKSAPPCSRPCQQRTTTMQVPLGLGRAISAEGGGKVANLG
jgi:hypothetical protein